MALPRLRPLGHLPSPFGSEWSLLPPNVSFRKELRALYAAVLRTFCLNVEEIRSLCRWTSSRHRMTTAAPIGQASGIDSFAADRTARTKVVVEGVHVGTDTGHAAVGSAANIGLHDHARHAEPVWHDMDTASAQAASLPSIDPAPQRAPVPLGMLAGGACALGGAAVLAWLALGHPAHRQTALEHRAADGVAQNDSLRDKGQADQVDRLAHAGQPAGQRAVEAGSARGGAGSSLSGAQLGAPSASLNRQANVASEAAATSAKHAPAIARGDNGTIASHRRAGRHDANRSVTAGAHRGTSSALAQNYAQSELAYAPSHRALSRRPLSHAANAAMPRLASPLSAHRMNARPSAAGEYSPLAPPMLGSDDYASVTMSAGTHLRGMASAPHAGSTAASSTTSTSSTAPRIDPNSTEWMSRMSQRRVTDIPDQFSR